MPSVLRQGDRGEAVRDLHQRLVGAGHGAAGEDQGEFGAATERAVRAFQEARGLRVDGVVGRQTCRRSSRVATRSVTASSTSVAQWSGVTTSEISNTA